MDIVALCNSHEYLRPLVRYKRRAIGCFLITVSLAAFGLAVFPRSYESEAKLFVRVGRENAGIDSTVNTNKVIGLNSSRETEINSIVEHLGSRYIIEKVLARISPELESAAPKKREAAVQKLQKSVSIESPHQTTVIRATCKTSSPEKAQRVVAALIEVYLDEHMRINRPKGSYEFFTEQAKLLKTQLEEAQHALLESKNAIGVSSLKDRQAALERQLNDVETRLGEVESNLSASLAKISTLSGRLNELPEPLVSQLVGGTPTAGLAGMREELYRLRIREQEILSDYTEEHPDAISIRNEVRQAEAALQKEQPEHGATVAAVVAREAAVRDSLIAQRETLQKQREALQERLADFNRYAVRIAASSRAVEQLEAKYLTYAENSEQARVDQALQADRISNINIVQPASYVPKPVSPKSALVFALAVLMGGFGGVCLAFVSEYLDRVSTELSAKGRQAARPQADAPIDRINGEHVAM